jgi:hypothetical protein
MTGGIATAFIARPIGATLLAVCAAALSSTRAASQRQRR